MNCEERRCQILLFLFKASLRTVCQREGKVFIQRAANVAQAAQVNMRTRSVSWIFTCSNFFLQDLVDYSHLTPVQSISLGHKVYCKFSTDFTGLQLISTQLISLDFNLSHWIAAYFTGMQYISLDLRVLHWIDQ